jgi:DNA-binding transcriptional ArsR family regulator
MQTRVSTTPFGRRPLSLAMVATQAAARATEPGAAVHKWLVYRAICEAKATLGITDRALAVLNALLTFHPETVLTATAPRNDDGDRQQSSRLVVFPSNDQLSLRAHGMAPATLRRHLAVLVDCGLLIRRDSPNGKRYARKGQGGTIETAFGFDLMPLVARAAEFERLAEAARAERRDYLVVRERITLVRRDIAKMIATGAEEGITGGASRGPPRRQNWSHCSQRWKRLLKKSASFWRVISILRIKAPMSLILSATHRIQTPTPQNLNLLSRKAGAAARLPENFQLGNQLNRRHRSRQLAPLNDDNFRSEWSSRPVRM